MKYLFTPPHSFNGRFELQYKVLVEGVRAPKGDGGGKGKAPPKELSIIGIKAEEVNECAEALKALDFSGIKTRELDNGLIGPSNNQKTAIEAEFSVFIFKTPTAITIFGSSANAASAMAKIEDAGYSKSMNIDADKIKVIYAHKLLDTWRSSTGASIQVQQPPQSTGNVSQPGKITVQGKSKEDTDKAMLKVEEYVNSTGSEVMKV